MTEKRIGDDLSKWYICKGRFGWLICPPVMGNLVKWAMPGTYVTGTDAIAAFARGGRA